MSQANVPVAAGTVLLLRGGSADTRVLMVRRLRALRSFGGLWVFPGGRVDAAESARAAADGRGEIAAAAAAGCRELAEEAGIRLDVGALRHFAHWITPSAFERRYDTHFFVAAAPDGAEPQLERAEASEARWVDPRMVATRGVATPGVATPDTFPLATPTQLVLREVAGELARCGGVQALLAQASTRRIRTVVPKMLAGGGVVLPWDPAYDTIPGEGLAWDAEGVALRAEWPGRLGPAPGVPRAAPDPPAPPAP